MSSEKKIYRIDEFLAGQRWTSQYFKTDPISAQTQHDSQIISELNKQLQGAQVLYLRRDKKKVYAQMTEKISFQNALHSVLKSLIIEYFGPSAAQWTIDWVQSRDHKDRKL